jgi:transcriptional antiterminator RfaH
MLGIADPNPAFGAPAMESDAACDTDRRWYAVQCQPHREGIAALNLRHQHFAAFLPYRRKPRRHARKVDAVHTPFFPGYLFVGLDLMRQQWRSINGTFGVVRLLMQGERPAAVPRGFVEVLQQLCSESDIMPLQTQLFLGQSVRVLGGPFADYIGELEQLSGADRVRVLLEVMGGRIPVLLPREDVVAADSLL